MGITRSGGTIVSGWSDGKIRAFYPESGKLKFVISDAHAEGTTSIALAHDDDTRPPWRLVFQRLHFCTVVCRAVLCSNVLWQLPAGSYC